VRIWKLIAIALGTLIALLVILLLAVRIFVNPNDYKDHIARAVRTATGRELALPGDIKLSVFPWIALELGPASLGNPPGFADEPFASVRHATLRVRLLPLLRKQLEIGRVEIDGLDLRLRRNASGRGNWQSAAESSPTPPSGGAGAPALRDLGGIVITDSRLSYQDVVADHFNLSVGRVAGGAQAPIKVKVDLIPSAGAQPIQIAGQAVLTLDAAHTHYRLAPIDLEGALVPRRGAARVSWTFSAPQVELDLDAQTLSVASVAARLGSARLSGTLKGSSVIDAPTFSGSFKLDQLSPRGVLSELGIAAPKTRDPRAFSKLAASGEFAYGARRVGVDKLDVQLDDSQLRGSAAITSLDTKALAADLTLNQIDIDRYRPPENAAKPAAQTDTKGEAPGDVLKTLELDGTFNVGAATFAGLRLVDGHMKIHARDGVTHVAPMTAKLYGGQYSGDVTLDDRGPVLASRLEQTVTGVDVLQLLKDFIKSQRLSGRGTITSNVTARGSTGDAVLKSLNGHVAASLANGALEGIDLWFEINRAIALIQRQSLPGGASTGRTRFESFKASADIVNGLATTRDLDIASQNLRVTGQGTANLVTQAIDYQVKASISRTAPTATASAGHLADIPLTITGSLADPKVRPDLEGIAKAQVQQQLDKHKQELLEKFQEQLKGLIK